MQFKPIFNSHLQGQPSSAAIWERLRRDCPREGQHLLVLTFKGDFKRGKTIRVDDDAKSIVQQVKRADCFYLIRELPPKTELTTAEDGKLIHAVFSALHEQHSGAVFLDFLRIDAQHFFSYADNGFWQ